MVAQVIHAAGESAMRGENWGEIDDEECTLCRHSYHRGYGYAYHEGCGRCLGYGWFPGIIHAVALSAKDEAQLLKLDATLHEKEVPHRTIREPDRNNEATAIGIEPVRDRSHLRRLLSRYPLLREAPRV